MGGGRLIVVVDDPKRFQHVISILRRRRICFSVPKEDTSFKPGDIVYTDIPGVYSEAIRAGARAFLDINGDDSVLERAILATYNKSVYNELSIGVDPGRRFVIVALADGLIVDYAVGFSVGEAISIIAGMLRRFPARTKVVRIGSGVSEGADLLSAVLSSKNLVSIARIEVVDEKMSTPKISWRNPFIERIIGSIRGEQAYRKDLYAAVVIALKKGVVVG